MVATANILGPLFLGHTHSRAWRCQGATADADWAGGLGLGRVKWVSLVGTLGGGAFQTWLRLAEPQHPLSTGSRGFTCFLWDGRRHW